MMKKSNNSLCIAVACMTASIFSLSGCEPHEGSERTTELRAQLAFPKAGEVFARNRGAGCVMLQVM